MTRIVPGPLFKDTEHMIRVTIFPTIRGRDFVYTSVFPNAQNIDK